MSTAITLSFEMDPYVSPYDYPSGYIQGGRKGIVISSRRGKTYRTAFVEFFPDNTEISMIRGEGKTIEEADKDAWDKLQGRSTCQKHEYEPRNHKNGAGFCKHCNNFKVGVFSGSDLGQLCARCQSPVLVGHKGGVIDPDSKDFLCSDHDPRGVYSSIYYEYGFDDDDVTVEEFRENLDKLKAIVFYGAALDGSVLTYFEEYAKASVKT